MSHDDVDQHANDARLSNHANKSSDKTRSASDDIITREDPPHTLQEDAAGQSAILAVKDDTDQATVPSTEDDRAGNVRDTEKQAQAAVQELDVEHVAGRSVCYIDECSLR